MDSSLSYKIYLPDSFKEDQKYPVIYAMHGMGSDEEDILSLAEELKNDFILVGIRGTLNQGSGFVFFAALSGYIPKFVKEE